ncbi:MAG: Ca-activated chloride channel family protein [Crocinitomicaceae bacterium]|jgi:Ca-activated chloride channel family protein
MNARWGEQTRIEAAKELLAKTVDGLRDVPNLEIGLRVYGHQSPITSTYQDCNDTKLEVPFAVDNFTKVQYRIKSIQAKGTTPIARSLEAAAGDFPDNEARNIIILITDGLEACDNDPCVIAKKLKDKGVKVTPFVIGLGMDLSYLEKFRCIGTYEDAETREAFKIVLENVVMKALLNTTTQIDLNDINGAPLETDVTMFLYEAGTTNLKYTYTHTLNRFGNPDTLIIDPSLKYDLVVNTIPRIEKKDIVLLKNIHNTIKVDAAQGFIRIRYLNAVKPYQIDARIMQAGEGRTLNVQKVGATDKYLVGTYDVEILTLPRTYITLNVDQGITADINIKAPGFMKYVSSNSLTGQLFMENENGRWDWVCNLEDKSRNGTIQLQPGAYRMVQRPMSLKSSTYTMQTDFRINSNKTTSIRL